MKLLVFDLGHVIVEFDWATVCKGFADRAGITSDKFTPVIRYLGSLGYERGTISTSSFLKELNQSLELELDLAEFTRLWNATFEADQNVVSIVDQLSQKWPLYLLSNTNENHFENIEERFNLARYFKELILSYQIGHTKPDAEIYEEVFRRSGLAPCDCLFVDDLVPNIEAAARLGMKTVLYKGANELKRQLNDLGVTV
jgi:HAD superfamily hydrolase (TIGR01509 family)